MVDRRFWGLTGWQGLVGTVTGGAGWLVEREGGVVLGPSVGQGQGGSPGLEGIGYTGLVQEGLSRG